MPSSNCEQILILSLLKELHLVLKSVPLQKFVDFGSQKQMLLCLRTDSYNIYEKNS